MLKQDAAPPVVQKTYEFVLWLVKKVESFPKAHRFTVGERLTAHSLDLLTTLVEAAYTRNKEKNLEGQPYWANSSGLASFLAPCRICSTRTVLRASSTS